MFEDNICQNTEKKIDHVFLEITFYQYVVKKNPLSISLE